MPNVTFSITTVVCVKIKGEKFEQKFTPNDTTEFSNFPISPNDGGLVRRFLEFQEKEAIHPIIAGGYSGGGGYLGFFSPQDASRIEAWLIEEKATRK